MGVDWVSGDLVGVRVFSFCSASQYCRLWALFPEIANTTVDVCAA